MEIHFGVFELRWSHFFTMFLICFVCHGELVRLRPKSLKYLTEFYLYMSFGGACGGLIVTLVATNYFNDYYEWFFCLVAGLGISLAIIAGSIPSWQNASMRIDSTKVGLVTIFFVLCVGTVYFWQDPFKLMQTANEDFSATRLHQSRNFYGAVSVKDLVHDTDPKENYRIFFSGQITHGMQFTHPDRITTPAAYHSLGSGVGETIEYSKSEYPSVNSKFYDDDGVLLSEEDPEIPGVPLWSDHFSSINAIELKD